MLLHCIFHVMMLSSIDYLKLPQGVLDDPNKPQHRESELQPQRQQSRWLHTYDEINEKWKIQELNP